MISTLLIDLDNTLLGNDMETFLPTYLQKLGAHLADRIPPDQMIPELLNGTRKMMENFDPVVSLEQVFAQYFYPALGMAEETLKPQIDDFYDTVFPSLKANTTRYPESERLMKRLFDAGYEIVIATSPLFPRTAILQRLDWAGVPVERFDYSLITSYEHFHFSKPHLEYYAEILGRLGKPPHETAMIGNDPENDLAPANALGMTVFHAHASSPDEYPGGSLEDAIPWLHEASNQTKPQTANQSQILLARHRGNLAALVSMTKDLDDHAWGHRMVENEWAPVEIVCHLRDVESEVNLPRLRKILSDPDPHLSSFDTDVWAEERDYLCQSGPNALSAYIDSRKETIAILEKIDSKDWSRPARHSLFGPTTLIEVMNIAAEHDLLHLVQLRSTLAIGGI
ncbi:MAG TPA: HAD family hydrolase [Anaerolineae bacterium]|nr:HAD family hydrolase [Anaerolineae bacterium]